MQESVLDDLRDIARAAGDEILAVYETNFNVRLKGDRSPITEADQRAHDIIEHRLYQLDSSIPVLSEESSPPSYETRRSWNRYWLVDPLDGTREFCKRNGEFTVNIALIENALPQFGVVGVPVKNHIYVADVSRKQAFFIDDVNFEPIHCKSVRIGDVVAVTSRSHATEREARLLEWLDRNLRGVKNTAIGSSLKICHIARSYADLYVKLSTLSEWDIGAAHAILCAAGGDIFTMDGRPFRYNRSETLSLSRFYVAGDPAFPWANYLAEALTFAEGK